jgi:flavin reductase (DIM6/NTAB) family NADH-FMN oxidoreductase RutF
VSDAFLKAFRHHPSGVAIITAESVEGPVALTISSLISVSVAPPTVAFSLSDNSSSARLFQQVETVAVHFVRRGDMQLARLCATGGAERFGPDVKWDRLSTGEPFYPQVELVFRAAIRGRLGVPGATLVAAELTAVRGSAREFGNGDSLVYADRTWHGLTPIADTVRTPLHLWPDDSATF